MSKILRRPTFRGGPVDSYGTGIASGLASGGRVGFDNGGAAITRRARRRIRGPQDFGITKVNPFFNPRMNIGTQRKPNFVDTPLYEEFPEVSQFPLTADAGTIMTDATVVDTGDVENLKTTADVEAGLETTNTNPDEFKLKETVTEKVKDGGDEVEVTMTDLEKALGLDKARRRDLGDMLGRASAAFLGAGDVREGLAEFMAAETKAGPSRTERIKSIAGLEEYKAKKAKELAEIKAQDRKYAPGNAEKNYGFFIKQGIDKDEALNLSMKLARNFDAAFLELKKQGTITSKDFDSLARSRNIDPLPNVDIETLEVGDVYYIPEQKSLVSIVLKEGKKDLLQTSY
jgi:hypothetical protein